MRSAINFNDEPCRNAREIGNERPNRMLSPEANAMDIFVQPPPDENFGVRQLSSKRAGT
jgi:hypothetical protein